MRVLLALLFWLIAPGAVAYCPRPYCRHCAAADIPASAISVVVQSVEGGPTRISHRAKVPMNPASVMKLVTTYVALDSLGPAWVWRTDALMTGRLDNGVLDGDLMLRGSGDPAFSMEQLWLLLRDIRARGVREHQRRRGHRPQRLRSRTARSRRLRQ
jgi:D-alanyl-D-alanine carboxypeptidase/D-alanyl-D-alanine-endopeptidase (penicillin-binding protein 4)